MKSTDSQHWSIRSPERIRLERDRHVAFAFAAADLLIEIGTDGRIIAASGATQAVLSVAAQALHGREVTEIVAPSDRLLVRSLLRQAQQLGRIDPSAVRLRRADGSVVRILLGACRLPNCADSIFLSLTVLSAALTATPGPRDAATGLLTAEALQSAAQRASCEDADGTRQLQLLRLDGLSGAIRQLQPERTSMLMQEIGAALRAASVGGDAAGRLSEDMFGIVSKVGLNANPDAALAADLRAAIRGAGLPDGQIAPRIARIDLSLGDLSGSDAGRALDYAMRNFVASRGREFSIGSLPVGLSAAVKETVSRFADTRQVIAEEKFVLVYQPVVGLRARTVHHYEALSRFPGERNTFEMVGFMEDVGLVVELDLAVTRRAIQDLIANPGIRLAVNLSGRSVQTEGFRAALRELVGPAEALRERLLFELTESSAVENLDEAADFLAWLRQLGHAVCLDDFGSGAAAYSYLRRFDIDYVKIDGPFLNAAIDHPRERALIRSICVLCNEIGCQVIGEMIENEKTAALAASLGIVYGQGWLFGRPSPELPKPVPVAKRRQGKVETWE